MQCPNPDAWAQNRTPGARMTGKLAENTFATSGHGVATYGSILSGILSDIRYSARGLLRNPGLTLALLFTIALGLGSNVIVRGFIRGLTSRNAPIAAKDRVVSLFGRDRYRGTGPVSYEDYLSLKSDFGVLDKSNSAFDNGVSEWIGAAQVSQSVVRLASQSAIKSVAAVTPNLAGLFNLSVDRGVVISRRVWQGEFRGETKVTGESVRIGDLDARVVGVAPDGLDGIYGDRAIDLWIALREETLQGRDRTTRNFWVLAELRSHVSTDRMKDAVRTAHIGSGEINVLPYTGMTPEMAEGLTRVGTLLQVAAGFVFFISCVNVGSFLLGRATARSHETSIRVALGVSRGLLARAVVADSIVISIAGGAFGVMLAAWTSRIVPALLFEQDAEFLTLAPDFFSIVVASAGGVGLIIACGLLPLFGVRYDCPAAVLGREGAGPSRASRAVRAGLILAQMASCCFLVICTGLLYEGFRAALQTGVGHRLGQPMLATVQVHPDVDVDLKYFRDVEQAARSLAGVTGMAWAGRLPGSQPAWQSFRVEPQGLPLREVKMDVAGFTSDSVAQFSWPPKAGRMFGFRDGNCRVAIVDEEGAEVLFGDDTAGRSIQDTGGMPVEIIGVAARKSGSATKRSRPTIYYGYTNQAVPPLERIAMARFSAPVASRLDRSEFDTNVVSPGYFAAMGFSLVAGRIFPDNSSARGCRVAVVNQEAADLYFGGNAVGAAIIDDMGRRTGIIGVVHSAPLGTFERRTEPTIYFPMVQDCLPAMRLIIGARAASGPMLVGVQHTLQSVPGRGPAPLVVQTMEAYLSQTALAPLHIATVIVGACAATALLLSVLGLYGTLNDAARARRRDLAIRIALGARRRHVIFQVLREGGRLAGVGALAGISGALLLSQFLPRIPSNIGSPKSWVWIVGPIVLTCAVAVAGVLPARRALMVDPLRILRSGN
jgi:ABC-type lipoprotein release transport system permease subunit